MGSIDQWKMQQARLRQAFLDNDSRHLQLVVQEQLNRIRYKPGMTIMAHASALGGIEIHYRMRVADADVPGMEIEIGRLVRMSGHELDYLFRQDESEFFHTIYRHLTHMEIHEAGEFFRVDGKKMFDPHR